ncbi:MAG: acyl-[acyl-carrier-protein] thioesterase [Muribaculaceae bacterium]|nr:acyl-[acyl-carrier-protein] thioesterase [Muribaculaceae bacterium]
MVESTLSREYLVKPSESDANRQLPLTMLVAQLIDVATDHANQLGIGFLKLEPLGRGWVLSRLSVEMRRWPLTGEAYVVKTWIESWNAHFSERCFSFTTKSGETLGYARTIWMIIDLTTHQSVGTGGEHVPAELIDGSACPIPGLRRHRPFTPQKVTEYVFKYCDLDFYRHVNTVRYISILLNQFTLADFDTHLLSRFDIAFAHEAKYGETAIIKSIEEEVETPTLLAAESYRSFRRTFEMSLGSQPILSSAIVMSRALNE